MEERYYIPKFDEIVTIDINLDKSKGEGYYTITKGNKVVKTSSSKIYSPFFYIHSAINKDIIDLFFEKEDTVTQDILAIKIEQEEDLELIDILKRYELLDKIINIDPICEEGGDCYRIAFIDNKIIKISTSMNIIYYPDYKNGWVMESLKEIKVLKTL